MPVLPTLSNDEISHYLTDGYWEDRADAESNPNIIRHSFPINQNGSLTIDMSTISAAAQFLAINALQAWTMVSGITFNIINTGGADITFTDVNDGGNPYGGSSWYIPSGNSVDGVLNVSADWLSQYGTTLDSYSFLTYMHEIGHVLGLGHAGYYNADGNATFGYAEDGSGANTYLNDSWQASIMSYFSPSQNTYIDASWGYFGALTGVMTPMIADILAIQELYGTATTLRTGDTTYGQGSNAGGYYDTAITAQAAFTIVDNGGIDSINFSNVTDDMRVDLTPESISDVGGFVGNMIIMRDTIIEKFFSGSGNDDITGNIANNVIWGGGGADVIRGGQGDDIIRGGAGNDILNGNQNNDMLIGEGGNDILRGGNRRDRLDGGAGNDRLEGGRGRDKLVGGTGADTFVFKDGWAVDRVSDFEDGIDTLELHSALWGGGAMDVATLLDPLNGYASVVANNDNNGGFHVVLNFGDGDILKIHGIDGLNLLSDLYFILEDDITII